VPERLAARSQISEAFLQRRDVVTQLVHRPVETLDLVCAGEQRLLLGPVLGEGAAGVLQCLPAPAPQAAPGLRHAVRGNVAEDAGKIFFDVPAQVARDAAHDGDELDIAGSLDLAPGRLVARG